jgi:hypothetical protein
MKKFFAILAAMGLAGSAFALTYTNRIGQVVTVDANGVVTSITDPTVPGSTSNTTVSISGSAQVDATTANADVAVLNLTPRQIGDFAIFLAGTNGAIYMAAGVTTNDWIELGQ